ncbi:cysteine hydrolase [Pyxidicoccus fallax]|uniref:Cysteine hydrolase n=1 Tax=Pyxidicoccus fallax TaxID=394095 RepID=A0A848LM41_9BACT|nr:cysteine hydrolase family protein [Pyxidicoccus fallax]NMO18740.1 cysteine hydrolase [Pyxidicoccus fallax]NPC79197.1 cysteine hydrolase [Pyxidicoccus fallax]
MTAPRTLSSMAGAPTHPSPFDRAALVIVDAQVEYTSGNLPLAGVGDAVAEIARLLDLARRHGTPIFHIVHHGAAGGPIFDPKGPGSAIISAVAPRDGEAVVTKGLPNSFAGTDLHARISATGRKELIVAGFMTHMCISATVRAALDLGYRNTVVASATATRDLPDPAGGVVPAAELQRAELAALSDLFAVVVKDRGAWG